MSGVIAFAFYVRLPERNNDLTCELTGSAKMARREGPRIPIAQNKKFVAHPVEGEYTNYHKNGNMYYIVVATT